MKIDWLTQRPVAHRGFHDAAAGVLENTLPAIEAAAERGFAVEIDVQPSADGVAMAFHDFSLDRLTGATGLVIDKTASELGTLAVGGGAATIPTLDQVLDAIDGRVPLFIEVKSRFLPSAEPKLCRAIARALDGRDAPIACMSFDPRVVADLLRRLPERPRGIVADGARDDAAWGEIDPLLRMSMATMAHWPISQPDFVAYSVRELPAASVTTVRWFTGVPILTWTVRTDQDRETARDHADQMIFEGFDPEA